MKYADDENGGPRMLDFVFLALPVMMLIYFVIAVYLGRWLMGY